MRKEKINKVEIGFICYSKSGGNYLAHKIKVKYDGDFGAEKEVELEAAYFRPELDALLKRIAEIVDCEQIKRKG